MSSSTENLDPNKNPEPSAHTPGGRSTVGATLSALEYSHTFQQTQNSPTYVVTVHRISVPVLHRTFYTIMTYIVLSHWKSLGLPEPTALNNYWQRFAHSVAVIAVINTHAVLYNKSYKYLSATMLQHFGTLPAITSGDSFPQIITMLVSSLGPLVINENVPFRTIHIPVIGYADITALIAQNLPVPFQQNDFNFWNSTRTKLKDMLVTTVDIRGTLSSNYWTLRPSNVVTNADLWTSARTLESARIYSPHPYAQIDQVAKIACIVLDKPLIADPGIANFSSSGFIESETLPTGFQQVPLMYREYPFFNPQQPAYLWKIEHCTLPSVFTPEVEQSDLKAKIAKTGTSKNRTSKRLSTSMTAASDAIDIELNGYLVTYIYFDHIHLRELNEFQRSKIVMDLSRPN
jgi:hypothetical protein